MCGLVGLLCKTSALREQLGTCVAAMLVQMGQRGPDSAGVAIYRDPAASGASKLTLYSPDSTFGWEALANRIADALGGASLLSIRDKHAVVFVNACAADAEAWVRTNCSDARVMSVGQAIEIYKEVGPPAEFVDQLAVRDFHGSHAIGHTRMATESRVTTAGSHPFSVGADLALVQNGSLSNHNRLRETLRRQGLQFETDNDAEVAAAYVSWQLREGKTLEEALTSCLEDLDGFYTFFVANSDGVAVLRDRIACKPAILAETSDWVAMASEYRAIAVLSGAADAQMWEPEPGVVYAWSAAA
jgi:methylamine---glutamate N-methyltransferase subunit A